ncbi:uncharacterized protein N0V96_011227 [Colletotrichum fioriniae]|uniref:uncharacterized protein n=1 Tax=Colletotrichum fioriniae TaxID=710243 RepID=UPI0032DAB971|nr:hypothetical protein N0V96_011227 [Colletotrichum fioriniae]
MAYVFDGYSEASSGRNTPRGLQGSGSGGGGGRQQRRYGNGDIPVGGLPGGIYYGTGRFYEENLRNEQRRRQQQQQQEREQNQQRHRHDPQWQPEEQDEQQPRRDQQQQPRYAYFGGFRRMDGTGPENDAAREASAAARAFLEALQREHWRRRQQEADAGGGGFGLGPGDGYGEVGEDDFGPTEEIRFEDLFGDIFGSFGGGGGRGSMGGNGRGGRTFEPRPDPGTEPGPGPGPGPDQGRTDGLGGQGGGGGGGDRNPDPAANGPGRNGGTFRPGYQSPPGHYGGGWYGYGPAFGEAARARRGGAGMTFADLFELYQSWPGPDNTFGDYDESGNMPDAYF